MTAAASAMGQSRDGERRRWGITIANLALLGLLVLGIAIWRYGIPLVERTLGSLGASIGAAAAAAANAMDQGIDQTYEAVVSDPWARDRLGLPVAFPPLDQIEWTQSTKNDVLTFAFTASGSRGKGTIRGRMRFTESGVEITSLEMSDERETRAILLPAAPMAE